MVPAKGAVTLAKPTSSVRRCTLAAAASTVAFFRSRSLNFSSASWELTVLAASISFQRLAVVSARARAASAWVSSARPCESWRSISGGVEFGEDLAGLDVGAEIDQPLAHVAIGPGVDGGFDDGFQFSGKDEGRGRLGGCGRDHRDSGHGEVGGVGSRAGVIAQARDEPDGEGHGEDEGNDEEQAAEAGRLGGRVGHGVMRRRRRRRSVRAGLQQIGAFAPMAGEGFGVCVHVAIKIRRWRVPLRRGFRRGNRKWVSRSSSCGRG